MKNHLHKVDDLNKDYTLTCIKICLLLFLEKRLSRASIIYKVHQ